MLWSRWSFVLLDLLSFFRGEFQVLNTFRGMIHPQLSSSSSILKSCWWLTHVLNLESESTSIRRGPQNRRAADGSGSVLWKCLTNLAAEIVVFLSAGFWISWKQQRCTDQFSLTVQNTECNLRQYSIYCAVLDGKPKCTIVYKAVRRTRVENIFSFFNGSQM